MLGLQKKNSLAEYNIWWIHALSFSILTSAFFSFSFVFTKKMKWKKGSYSGSRWISGVVENGVQWTARDRFISHGRRHRVCVSFFLSLPSSAGPFPLAPSATRLSRALRTKSFSYRLFRRKWTAFYSPLLVSLLERWSQAKKKKKKKQKHTRKCLLRSVFFPWNNGRLSVWRHLQHISWL